jgi:hypothetical protein
VLDVDGDEETYLLGSREDSHDELEILSADSGGPMVALAHGRPVLDGASSRLSQLLADS